MTVWTSIPMETSSGVQSSIMPMMWMPSGILTETTGVGTQSSFFTT